MPVAHTSFARSVTYTVTDKPGSNDLTAEDVLRRRRRPISSSVLRRNGKAAGAKTHGMDPSRMECRRCDVAMNVVASATRGLHYLQCPKCATRLASTYEEVLRAGAAARPRSVDADPTDRHRWRAVVGKAEDFHRRLDQNDPYGVLGVTARTPISEIRARYHELAALHHPDHGGDPASMRRLIAAYERIRSVRQKDQ